MIISHKHKFIFIKTNKTAGTSLEIALSKFCGSEDIITPVVNEDEIVRQNLSYLGPQNYSIPFKFYTIKDYYNLFRHFRKKKYFHHMTAFEIKNNVEPYIWDNYFKFTIERNPYDRVISFYYWKFPNEPRPTLLEFLQSDLIMRLKQWGYNGYTIDHKIVVDKILKYENLKDELESLQNILNFDSSIELPQTKYKNRKNKPDKTELIGLNEKKIIERLFQKEFELFKFKKEFS